LACAGGGATAGGVAGFACAGGGATGGGVAGFACVGGGATGGGAGLLCARRTEPGGTAIATVRMRATTGERREVMNMGAGTAGRMPVASAIRLGIPDAKPADPVGRDT